jgi:ribonuclease P/MRP protein subunit POP5
MKILPPTLRESNRYLAFSATSEGDIPRRDLVNEILFCAATLFGDTGSSEMGISLLSFEENKGIIQCRVDMVWETRAVLATVKSIKGMRTRIQVLGVSGTVRGATEKYLLTQDINEPEPDRKRTQTIKECMMIIDVGTISGKIISRNNNEIDLLSEDPHSLEILNRSNTRYFGITIFDIKDKEIDL